jgi:putative copper export protein
MKQIILNRMNSIKEEPAQLYPIIAILIMLVLVALAATGHITVAHDGDININF